MARNDLLLFVIILFGISFSFAISSANYNIDGAVVSSGGTSSSSGSFSSKIITGIISGITHSLNFNAYLGLFYGSDTTEPEVEILYPLESSTYYSYVGNINYSVDLTGVSCWFSKDSGVTNSSVVVAGANWTDIYSGSSVGDNSWTVYCNDSAGNVGSDSITFLIDNEIPNVYFSGDTPVNDFILDNSYFTINATSSDGSGEHSTFVDIDNSLVGWWRLEETDDGVTFVDSSENGNDGTCSGAACPNVTGGKRGLAYEFDGVDDYVSFSQINVGYNYTLSAWVYPGSETDSDWFNVLSNKGSPQWGCPDSSLQFQLYGRVVGSVLTRYSWSYVTLIRNGDSHKLYVNGVLDAESSISASSDSYRVIGSYVYDTVDITNREPWHGSIDDVMIFNRSLSDSEIKSIYDAQIYQYGNEFSNFGNGNYNYTVYAQDLAGNINSSLRSLEVNMIPSDLNVSVVNNNTLNSGIGSLNLSWLDGSNGEDGFSIDRSDDNSSFINIDSVEANEVDYFDENLNDNTQYFYKIRSFIGETYSDYSNIAFNITADRTAPLNPFFELIENSSENGINVEFDESDDGLILYMPFEEGTGSSASDWSGEKNDGTVIGASWVSGDVGNGGALSFDTSAERYVRIADTDDPHTELTLSAWIKPVGNGGSNGMSTIINGKWAYYLSFNDEFNSLSCYWYGTSPAGYHTTSTNSINLDEWTYVSCVWDGAQIHQYINGIEKNTVSVTGTGNDAAYIMLGMESSARQLDGLLDEVRIYNRSLTQEEIINDMQSGLIKHKIFRSETEDGEYFDVSIPVVNGDAEFGNLTNFAFDGVTSESYEGDFAFYETDRKSLISSNYIPIDVNSEYILSGMFKSNGSGGLSKLYYGFVPYDKNKQWIRNEDVNVRSNTQTTLYDDIVSTDKIVKISDCLSWYVLSHGRMVFNIDDSGNYADLPNRDMSNNGISRVENMGDYCEIEFPTTVGKTYPAGTKIRMHSSGSGYMYSAASPSSIPTTWTKYSTGVMSGENLYGASYSNSFWPGTRYVKLLFLANYAQDSTYQFLADNLKLTVNGGNVSTSNYLDFTGFDRTSPSGVSNVVSSEVVENGFSTLDYINFSWDEATDSGDDYFYYVNTEDSEGNYNKSIDVQNKSITADVAGYSVLCDDWKLSIPNDLVDTLDLNSNCSTSEGVNYFHIKALDGSENAGEITHFGPFFIDSGAPEIEFSSSTPENETFTTNISMVAKVLVTDYSLNDLNFSWGDKSLSSLDDGLVLAMNFQNLSSLGENDSFVSDVSGSGNDGTVVGASYSEDGKFGKAMNFDGDDDYIDYGDIQNPIDAITLSAWVYPTSLKDGLYNNIIDHHYGYELQERNDGKWRTYITLEDASWQSAICQNEIESDTWQLVTGTYNSVTGDIKTYVNGKWCVTNHIDGNKKIQYGSTNTLSVGSVNTGDGRFFQGSIDEVRIYNRSLSEDEIKLLYQSNLQKLSLSDWSLEMNMTNISRGDYLYSASACDMADNCNSTEERLWSRVNTPPFANSVVISSSGGGDRSYDNLSINSIDSYDLDWEDSVLNITDWKVNGESLAVLNMPFEGGSSSSWTRDYSENGNNGTVYGAIWNSSGGKVGGGYEFDGLNDYINIGNDQLQTDVNKLAVSVWFKGIRNADFSYIIHSSSSTSIGTSVYWIGADNNGYITGAINGQYGHPTSISESDEYWHNVVLSWDGSIVKTYVDGELEVSYTVTSITNNIVNSVLDIGGKTGSSRYFNGSIDEVLIFNRSLSEEQVKEIYDVGIANHSLEKIVSQETVDGENWSVVVTPNDLIIDGISVESNVIVLENNLPTVTLTGPVDGADIIERQPQFNWTGYDADGDTLTYELDINEHKSSGVAICNDDISRSNVNDEYWDASSDLKCLGDYGYYYTWKVRAYDGEAYGDWSEEFNFTLSAYVIASLVNNEVSFGSLGQDGVEDTSDGTPQPFIIQNDGNVQINISANATSMWSSQSVESEYYKVKIDNRSGEEGAFNWLGSVFDWINMSITGRAVLIDKLEYGDSADSAEIDIYLEVPPNEGPGLKSSTVVFEASFAEEESV